ncbi:MAG: Transaldolase [Gemmatimonadaceae bacterium]|nr:Transaldolase [Gemmatimonadaceae bacterium]
MKILLASSSLDDIRWAMACGLVDGVLVSASHLEVDYPGADARGHATEVARLFPCPVVVSSGSRDAEELYREARECARLSDQLVFEFPLAIDTVEQLHRAVGDGARIAASMIFTTAQAILAAKAGAAAVLVHVNALEAQGLSASATLREMRGIFDLHRIECEIYAVTPSSAGQVGMCAAAGVDAVVLENSVLRDLLLHPLDDRTLDALLIGAPRNRTRSAR